MGFGNSCYFGIIIYWLLAGRTREGAKIINSLMFVGV